MITQLSIKGYKSIRSQDIQLEKVNILIGGNGIGKTNFISCFELMRNLYEKNLQNYVLMKGGADALLFMGRKTTPEVMLDLHFDHDGNKNRYIVELAESQNRLFVKQASTAFWSNRWHFQLCDKDVLEASLKDDRKGQAWYVGPLLEEFEIYHFHDTGDRSEMKKPSNINDNRFLRPDGSNIAAFLYYLQQRHQKHFERIEHAVAAVSPFFESFHLEPNRLNPELIDLEWMQKGAGNTYFNSNQLSDGSLRFICLATLLMQPNPPKTILIDEPELGLHPTAINMLAALIHKVNATSQIIISTQSVNLINNFDPEDIIIVDRKDGASQFQRLQAEELNEWLETYTLGEVWEKNIIGGRPF